MSDNQFWKTIRQSEYPHEQDGLDFIKGGFNARDPYRAWSNFEFTTPNGAIYEVDLLLLTPRGFFMIELKHWSGKIVGDAGCWLVSRNGSLMEVDNPNLLNNRKTKFLKGMLEKTKPFRGNKSRPPFLNSLVFLSHPDVKVELTPDVGCSVFQRDIKGRLGIRAAVYGPPPQGRRPIDATTARALARAMDEVGIRPSRRNEMFGDFQTVHLLDEGPYYQDYVVRHRSDNTRHGRVRVYPRDPQNPEFPMMAFKREVRTYDRIDCRGVLKMLIHFPDHERGAGILFEHRLDYLSLGAYLSQNKDATDDAHRLYLLRQIAEILREVHQEGVYHRGLSPRAVLVANSKAPPKDIKLKIFNWQIARGEAGMTTITPGGGLAALTHPQDAVYQAPELYTEPKPDGELLDVFSLGALAYHLFTGRDPARTRDELALVLREGLEVANELPGAPASLRRLITNATRPDYANRTESAEAFLKDLDDVEAELLKTSLGIVEPPTQALVGQFLEGGFKVKKRLGRGATSVVFLVQEGEDHKTELVLKLAADTKHNNILEAEYRALAKLRHPNIIPTSGLIEVSGHQAIKLKLLSGGTLAERLKKRGRLQLELLQRFGDELLDAVVYLDRQGVAHRDIKPANIGLDNTGRQDQLTLFLFDFSLTKAPYDNITLGTPGYLDPHPRERWDTFTECWSAAVTLYEMAAGLPPKMKGRQVKVIADLFEPGARHELFQFFKRAFQADTAERWPSPDEMRLAWRRCFEKVEQPAFSNPGGGRPIQPETPLSEIPLTPLALNALQRTELKTIGEFVNLPLGQIKVLPDIGSKTRRELLRVHGIYTKLLNLKPIEEEDRLESPTFKSIDLILNKLVPPKTVSTETGRIQLELLGIDQELKANPEPYVWPTPGTLSRHLKLERTKVHAAISKAVSRWERLPEISQLRNDILQTLNENNEMMTADELTRAILFRRGSAEDEPERTRWSAAVTRAALEVEAVRDKPRWRSRLHHQTLILVRIPWHDPELADQRGEYAAALGELADHLVREDPLPSLSRASEILAAEPAPLRDQPLPHQRLLRLAAATSNGADLSTAMELYPRGMSAKRALALSMGALLGVSKWTLDELCDLVADRYPEAKPLTRDSAKLDEMLGELGSPLRLEGTNEEGLPLFATVQSEGLVFSHSSTRFSDTYAAPSESQAKHFQHQLEQAHREGRFLVLNVRTRHMVRARERLLEAFELHEGDWDAMLLHHLHHQAQANGIKWEVVLKADAEGPDGPHWKKLKQIVDLALTPAGEQLRAAPGTLLLTNPGLIARYQKLDQITRLRGELGKPERPRGLWLLVPRDDPNSPPMIDGQSLALMPSQWLPVPEPWLKNESREDV